MAKEIISAAQLRELFYFDENTGEFLNKRKRNSNGAMPGTKAGYVCKNGYVNIKINRRSYLAHRLAWLYHYGVWPNEQIDHINHLRSDNRIANLRDVSPSENRQNLIWAHKNNLCGVLGVSKSKGKYQASIELGGRRQFLGTFECPSEAKAAYLQAKIKTHPAAIAELL